jgi:hypothetical protein
LVNRLLTGERRSPSQPATPDANALPGQPALRPLAGGILGRHRSIARRPPARARPWSCARRANAGQGRAAPPRPTRGQGSQRCPCERTTAFSFCLKRSTAYGANGKRTLPHVDHEHGAGPCRTSSGLRGTQPIRLEQKFEFLVRRSNRRIQWIGQCAARNSENECSR